MAALKPKASPNEITTIITFKLNFFRDHNRLLFRLPLTFYKHNKVNAYSLNSGPKFARPGAFEKERIKVGKRNINNYKYWA